MVPQMPPDPQDNVLKSRRVRIPRHSSVTLLLSRNHLNLFLLDIGQTKGESRIRVRLLIINLKNIIQR